MTQHTDLIERLRRQSAELADTGRTLDYSAGVAAANALEAQAREIAELKAFTGEPYKANEDLDAALTEIGRRECLFWEACKPHGKVGEVVYMTYKTKRDAKGQP
jgi:hypothetical protein